VTDATAPPAAWRISAITSHAMKMYVYTCGRKRARSGA
jgi:hypothetical protein